MLEKAEVGSELNLLQIKRYLEDSRGLYTLGVKAPLSRLDVCFDHMLCVVHCKGERSPNGHLLVLEKEGKDYLVADMGDIFRLPGLGGERRQLNDLSKQWEMTGVALLVSKEPMEIPRPEGMLAVVTSVLMLLIMLAVLLRRYRPFGRGNKASRAVDGPPSESSLVENSEHPSVK